MIYSSVQSYDIRFFYFVLIMMNINNVEREREREEVDVHISKSIATSHVTFLLLPFFRSLVRVFLLLATLICITSNLDFAYVRC